MGPPFLRIRLLKKWVGRSHGGREISVQQCRLGSPSEVDRTLHEAREKSATGGRLQPSVEVNWGPSLSGQTSPPKKEKGNPALELLSLLEKLLERSSSVSRQPLTAKSPAFGPGTSERAYKNGLSGAGGRPGKGPNSSYHGELFL